MLECRLASGVGVSFRLMIVAQCCVLAHTLTDPRRVSGGILGSPWGPWGSLHCFTLQVGMFLEFLFIFLFSANQSFEIAKWMAKHMV